MSIDRKILAAFLRAGPGAVHGSESIRELGISEAVLGSHLAEMRSLGYEITHTPHLGYRLQSCPDLLHADAIQALLAPNAVVGREVQVFQETNSTNDVIEKLARDDVSEGVVVYAESQTRGRGRLGRKWISPKGQGLWFSVLLRPKLPVSVATQFTIAAATAIARAVSKVTGLQPAIKWPNDLLLGQKKFAGILTELHAEADQIGYVILGIGIDVNCMEFPPEIKNIATSLRIEGGILVDRVRLAAAVLKELDDDYHRLKTGQFETVANEWESLCSTLGRQVAVDIGGRKVVGFAESLDKDGSLLLRTQHGHIERIFGGELQTLGP